MQQTPNALLIRSERNAVNSLPRNIEIDGDRVLLRFAELDQAEAIFRRVTHPEFPRELNWALATSRHDVEARLHHLHAAWEVGESYFLGVFEKEGDSLIGHGSLSRADNPNEWSFAYMIDLDHQGCGYATEVAMHLIDLAFGRLGAELIWAGAATWNIPSLRVLEKLPMRYIVTNPKGYAIKGKWIETREYEITRLEWTSRSDRRDFLGK